MLRGDGTSGGWFALMASAAFGQFELEMQCLRALRLCAGLLVWDGCLAGRRDGDSAPSARPEDSALRLMTTLS